MILVDANILLYAYHPRSEHHETCRVWLETAFSGAMPVRLAWISIQAFVRLSTHLRVFENPLSMREAIDRVSEWLSAPAVAILEPGERYWDILSRLLVAAQITGPLVTDASLAALALEHGATVATTDRDFTRFEQLRIFNPLST